MKCKGKFINLLAVLVIGFSLVSLSLTASNNAVEPRQAQYVADTHSLNHGHYLPPEVWQSSDNRISHPMDRVFQIIFILFFISPPLIVVLLFLIWCEMKKRNEGK
jgi:hypothetical protein